MPAKSALSYAKSTCVNTNNSYSQVGSVRHALHFFFLEFMHLYTAAPGSFKHLSQPWAYPVKLDTGIWLRPLIQNLWLDVYLPQCV